MLIRSNQNHCILEGCSTSWSLSDIWFMYKPLHPGCSACSPWCSPWCYLRLDVLSPWWCLPLPGPDGDNILAQNVHLAMATFRRWGLGSYGGFHKWGTPKWMVYKGKSHENGWFGGTPILRNPHISTSSFQWLINKHIGAFSRGIVYVSQLLVDRIPQAMFGVPGWSPGQKCIPSTAKVIVAAYCHATVGHV